MPTAPRSADAARGVARDSFGTAPDGHAVEALTLTNARGTTARLLTYGGVLQSLRVRDRHGAIDDVTLGYDTLDGYLADRAYFGALIGRYGNRIARGRFTLDGRTYALATNDGRNHLHGGTRGFNAVHWHADPFVGDAGVGVILRYDSPDGEEDYPGRLGVHVTCTLGDDDALTFDYHATTDAPTHVNLTQHSYWNLAGAGRGASAGAGQAILGHELTIAASRFLPVDESLIPTGELRPVAGTPFDFTTPHAVGARLGADDEQLRFGNGGYDHTFVLDDVPGAVGPRFAARLHDPSSGRTMEIHTTEPGLQFYSGNVLDGVVGKAGRAYHRHDGLALETQHFPDSPNQPSFPTTVLRPGETYASRTEYRFGVGG